MKKTKHLTIDMGLARLAAIIKEAGTDEVPFLAECTSAKEMQLCDILPARAGASDLLRRVSRDGVMVGQVMLYPPSETTHARPYLTAKEASAKLEELKAQMGGEAPLLTDGKGFALRLCDIRLDRHGAGSVYKRVSRGGMPVALVTFGAPSLD
jgi:hypothetical protein